MITVYNLKTGRIFEYSGLSPLEAVRNAHAQGLNDWNTWTYQKYDALVQEGRSTVSCGDWSTFKDITTEDNTDVQRYHLDQQFAALKLLVEEDRVKGTT